MSKITREQVKDFLSGRPHSTVENITVRFARALLAAWDRAARYEREARAARDLIEPSGCYKMSVLILNATGGQTKATLPYADTRAANEKAEKEE